MAQTPMYDPLTTEVQSPLIAGLTEACSKLSGILNTKISVMTDYPLTEVYISDDDRYRIYQSSLGNKLWLSNPSPVFYKNGIEITPENDSFTVDYLGGSITFDEKHRLTDGDKLTVDATFVIGGSEVIDSIRSELSSIGISVEKYKGYFSSYDELIGDYSSGNAGDYAIVGGTESAFYIWNDTTNNWEIVGKEPDLSNFYTQEETNSLLEKKQDKLIGSSGQIVGFDKNGNVVAQEAPQSGVTSFNGRTGSVIPKYGDYTAEMVSAAPFSEIERIDSVLYGSDIAIGMDAFVTEYFMSIALGASANASGTDSTAIGRSARASESESTAIGAFANASGSLSTAIGASANASGMTSTALGRSAWATGTESTALGYYADASGNSSTSLGHMVTASGNQSTAIGSSANASDNYTTALGHTATASVSHSTALGFNANASAQSSTALGATAKASATGSTALGYTATASENYTTALGATAKASGLQSTALGFNANASAQSSTALGYYAVSSNTNSIQLGNASTLSGLYCRVAITVQSDARDKADITPIKDGAVEFLDKIKAVQYVWNGREMYIDTENLLEEEQEKYSKYGMCEYDRNAHLKGTKKGTRKRVGVLAQDVQKALKDVYGSANYANIVNDNLFDYDDVPDDVESRLGVTYENFIPFLIKAIQELNERLKILEGA